MEMMLAVVVFMLMSAGLTAALLAGRSSWMVNESTSIVQQQARNALWVLAKDFRQAEGLNLVTDAHSVNFSFTHAVDGVVSYTWNDTSQKLTRTAGTKVRDIGTNITGFTLTDLGYGVEINLIVRRMSTNKKATTMVLKEKVVYR
jgi:Tfp pilus assembly protein PilW